jgi:hypothetical protein
LRTVREAKVIVNKRLVEMHRITQIGLEQHRHDPECADTWRELVQARKERDAEWLRHTTR